GIATVGGNTSGSPVTLTLSNVTLRHNRAVGGTGNTAGTFLGTGQGGGLAGSGHNPFGPPVSMAVTVNNSTITDNQAVGGQGVGGGAGGDGRGGGLANLFGAILTVSGSTLSGNQALGGVGGSGGNGGSGLGGGLFNDGPSTFPTNPGAPTVLKVEGSALTHNQAQGGAAGAGGRSPGDGSGGGLWNGGAAYALDTAISHNHALGGEGADGS